MYLYSSTRSLLLLAILFLTPASAEVYRSIDEYGNVSFSNKAEKGAEPVKLRPLSVYDAPTVKPASNNNNDDSDNASGYESVEIVAPKAEETVRDNPGNVTATVSSKPTLDRNSGHRFQFFLDGKAIDKPQIAATKVFTNVDRGEHRVEVAIVAGKGHELVRSKAIRFFLHRQTIFNPARKGAAN